MSRHSSLLAVALGCLGAACSVESAPPAAGTVVQNEAWNQGNHPLNLGHSIEFAFAELPLEGTLEEPVWAKTTPVLPGDAVAWTDTYWPTAEGSINNRWLGADVLSPVEKYDMAFSDGASACVQPEERCGDGAKAEWAAYLTCVGPATRWQTTVFQNGKRMFDGVDSDFDGRTDECRWDFYEIDNGDDATSEFNDDNDGIDSWWGLCHAWAPAALLEPEPQHAVTLNGVTFEVSDIKALLIAVYDGSSGRFVGGRCNELKVKRDADGRATDPLCRDTNPGTLHLALANLIGIDNVALIEDKTANAEVWNQPVLGYRVTSHQTVAAATAMACIRGTVETDTEYAFNDFATEFVEVELDLDYLNESNPSTRPQGTRNTATDSYHYILELDAQGHIIGGEYCEDSQASHPDFLWTPQGPGSTWSRNPHISLAQVHELLALSRKPPSDPETPVVVDGGGEALPQPDTAPVPLGPVFPQ